MKILTIIGARPQFIKAAPLSKAFKENSIDEIIVHTGQHYDENMSNVFFDEMDIPKPEYALSVGSGNHGEQTGKMLIKIEEILLKELPTAVLVFGDTNSTLAGALAASKLLIPVIHVEAGLRSYDKKMPEEQNRIMTDHISSLLFSPSIEAQKILIGEGIVESRIAMVGDIMYDSYKLFSEYSSNLEHDPLDSKSYILATIHRAENTNSEEVLKNIFNQLIELSHNRSIIIPLHPRTRKRLNEIGIIKEVEDKLNVLEPVGFFDMLSLIQNSSMILTDSGGLQKEAYFARKLCITIRNSTEWMELVHHGYNKLVDVESKGNIIDAVQEFDLQKEGVNWKTGIYGDGKTAYSITEKILRLNETGFFNTI